MNGQLNGKRHLRVMHLLIRDGDQQRTCGAANQQALSRQLWPLDASTYLHFTSMFPVIFDKASSALLVVQPPVPSWHLRCGIQGSASSFAQSLEKLTPLGPKSIGSPPPLLVATGASLSNSQPIVALAVSAPLLATAAVEVLTATADEEPDTAWLAAESDRAGPEARRRAGSCVSAPAATLEVAVSSRLGAAACVAVTAVGIHRGRAARVRRQHNAPDVGGLGMGVLSEGSGNV